MSKEKNKIKGNLGEDIACDYLKNLGVKIIERNFYSAFGEIDIIANDHTELVFIEVKTRFQDAFGSPSEAIDTNKKIHLYNASLYYIYSHNLFNTNIRFDVINIQMQNDIYHISHLKNVIIDYPHTNFKRRF